MKTCKDSSTLRRQKNAKSKQKLLLFQMRKTVSVDRPALAVLQVEAANRLRPRRRRRGGRRGGRGQGGGQGRGDRAGGGPVVGLVDLHEALDLQGLGDLEEAVQLLLLHRHLQKKASGSLRSFRISAKLIYDA